MTPYLIALTYRECLHAHLEAAKERGDTQAINKWSTRIRRHAHKVMAMEMEALNA